MAAVVVLGAGSLGGETARAVAGSGAASRVTLLDDAVEVARGKALDITQAAAAEQAGADVRGTDDPAVLVGAAAVVVADRHVASSSSEWAGDGALQLLVRVRGLNPRALIVCAGASQLDLVERAAGEQRFDRRRLLATAPEALRAAMIALTSLEARCGPREVSLALLGRPPATAFVPWGHAAIGGLQATDVLDPPAIARLDARLARLWPPGPLALAVAASRVVRLALTGRPGTACVFAVPDAIATRGASLPATFSPAGVHVTVPRLATRDRVRLEGVLGS